MKISQKQATLATIAYADIFNFPLRREELRRWLIFSVNPAKPGKEAEIENGLYVLKGRKSIVKTRLERAKAIPLKYEIAKKMAGLLKLIPTVKLVGVTGGLAMGNADAKDDIDFFIITSTGALWFTRFFATLIMEFTGRRRHPKEKEVGNSICLNMFMTENHLEISEKDRDLFSAHEVLQMTPVWERGGAYAAFISNNNWVRKFLPNAWKASIRMVEDKNEVTVNENIFVNIVEPLFKRLQLRYMKNHRTTEIITDTVIRFHPHDARVWIREELGRRLRRFNIPLDSIFYSR